jgi:threonine aldolase
MLFFRNDYSNGAHPKVLEMLCKTNLELTVGYGLDPYCQKATEMIRSLCHCPQADVHYIVGGTQANKTALGAFLRPWEAVICADSGHIQVHETGAIEHNGHRLYLLPASDGKVLPQQVEALCRSFAGEETAPAPRVLYISNTTELGTVYTKQELQALRQVCDENELYLYCDGARLACAMAVTGTTFADYAATCDAFTIGGTKNGLLFGEALVITNPALMPHFRRCLKQQGAMLAKGRLLGVQYCAALEDGLYLRLAQDSMKAATRLDAGLRALQLPLLIDSPSNQLFPILPNAVIEQLEKQVSFEIWGPVDENSSAIRFVTAWHTTGEEVDALLDILRELTA